MGSRLTHVAVAFSLAVSLGCGDGGKSSVAAGTPDAAAPSRTKDDTSTSSGQISGAPVNQIIEAVVVVPETQYPPKQLPLPASDKMKAQPSGGGDPTLNAYRALLNSAMSGGRSGPAPFQMFVIPDPLNATASLPLKIDVPDVAAPVPSYAGRPLPVLK